MFHNNIGEIHIITGTMCCGKSTELLRRGERHTYVGRKVVYINHDLDKRSKELYSTHSKLHKTENIQVNIKFTSASKLKDLLDTIEDKVDMIEDIKLEDFDVICIDEGQFFPDLKEMVTYLAEILGKCVLVAGLTNDFKREKFGQILDLEPISDSFTKLCALCKYCSWEKKAVNAIFSHRLIRKLDSSSDEEQIKVGGMEDYVPLCRKCYLIANKKTKKTKISNK